MTYDVTVGTCRVTVLEVATVERSPDQIAQTYPGAPRDELLAALGGPVTWSFNLLLLRFASSVLLVDTGFGFADAGQAVPTSEVLAEAGVAADEVTAVVITHAHGDHIGGLVHEGSAAFPEAELLISGPELDYWTGGAGEGVDPERSAQVGSALEPYAERTHRFTPGETIRSGDGTEIVTIAAPGHTPGHTGIAVVSGSHRLTALVDTLHAAVQLEHPEWSPRFDADPVLAEQTRRRLLAHHAAKGDLVHFYHLAFPGLGRIEADGPTWRWAPDA